MIRIGRMRGAPARGHRLQAYRRAVPVGQCVGLDKGEVRRLARSQPGALAVVEKAANTPAAPSTISRAPQSRRRSLDFRRCISGFDQVVADGGSHEVSALGEIELVPDVTKMRIHGLGTDVEKPGNLLGRISFGDELDHSTLALGQVDDGRARFAGLSSSNIWEVGDEKYALLAASASIASRRQRLASDLRT